MMEAGVLPSVGICGPMLPSSGAVLSEEEASYLGTSDGAMDWEKLALWGLRRVGMGVGASLGVRLDKRAPGCPSSVRSMRDWTVVSQLWKALRYPGAARDTCHWECQV